MRNILYVCFILFFLIRCAEDSLEVPTVDDVQLIRNGTHTSVTFYEMSGVGDDLGFQLSGYDFNGDARTLFVNRYNQADYPDGTSLEEDELTLSSGKSIAYNSAVDFKTTGILGDFVLEFTIRDSKGNRSLPYAVGYMVTYEPEIEVRESGAPIVSYDFGNVTVSTTDTVTISIHNVAASGDLNISVLTFSGTNSDLFGKQSDDCSGATITPASSETVDITFTPDSFGLKEATLEIPYNHVGTPVKYITLQGTGT